MSRQFRLAVVILMVLFAAFGWLTNPWMPWSARWHTASLVFCATHGFFTGLFTVLSGYTFLWYNDEKGRKSP